MESKHWTQKPSWMWTPEDQWQMVVDLWPVYVFLLGLIVGIGLFVEGQRRKERKNAENIKRKLRP